MLQPLDRPDASVAGIAMWVSTTGAGIVQTKIANSSKRGTSRAIFKWTRQWKVFLFG